MPPRLREFRPCKSRKRQAKAGKAGKAGGALPLLERKGTGGSTGALPLAPSGEMISPEPPRLQRETECGHGAGSVGWRQVRRREGTARGGKDAAPRPEGSAGAVRAASSVQVCPLGPTCGGRPLLPLRGIIGTKEGISRILMEKSVRRFRVWGEVSVGRAFMVGRFGGTEERDGVFAATFGRTRSCFPLAGVGPGSPARGAGVLSAGANSSRDAFRLSGLSIRFF